MTQDPDKPEKPGSAASTKPGTRTAEGDDRNLILVDDDFTEAEFEDKVWLFWSRYRQWILIVAVGLLVGVPSVQIFNYMRVQAAEQVREDYRAAGDDRDALRAFSDDHPDHPLAGIALLRVADSLFTRSDWEGAATQYRAAAEALVGTQFAGRARFGQAMANLRKGDRAFAKELLDSVFLDGANLFSLRQQAAFYLAKLELEDNNPVRAAGLIRQMQTGVLAQSFWTVRAQELMQTHPLLAGERVSEVQQRFEENAGPVNDSPATDAPIDPVQGPAPAPAPEPDATTAP